MEETVSTISTAQPKAGSASTGGADDFAAGSESASQFFLETLRELKKGFLVQGNPSEWPSVREKMHKVAHELLEERRADAAALASLDRGL